MPSFTLATSITFWEHQLSCVHTCVGTVKHHPLSCSTAYTYSIVCFKHHEDRHKLEMPGHKGMFLGYSNVSDGVYVQNLDNKKKPVRIT